jgi:hypothetical protein
MELLKITNKQSMPFLIPQRALERDDFAPVREEANAIHFLLFDDDQYDVEKEGEWYRGTLKLRFRHAPELRENLKNLEKSGTIKLLDYHTSNLVDICRVYTLVMRAETKEKLDVAMQNKMNSYKDGLINHINEKLAHFNLVGITMGVQK